METKNKPKSFTEWVRYAQGFAGFHGDIPDDAFEYFYDYFTASGEMPYGVAKARTGDPYSWIADKLNQMEPR